MLVWSFCLCCAQVPLLLFVERYSLKLSLVNGRGWTKIVNQKIRRLPGFPLHIASWGTEFAVYHEGSGNTHLLDEYGHAVLRSVENQAAELSDIVSRCADLLNIEEDAEFSRHIQQVVRQLAKHDLIEIVR